MFWLVLGGLIVGVQLFIRMTLQKQGKAKLWPNCILVLITNLTIAFGISWAYSSVLEYEMQAAMMGLLVFGGVGIILAIVSYRVINNPKGHKSKEKEKNKAN